MALSPNTPVSPFIFCTCSFHPQILKWMPGRSWFFSAIIILEHKMNGRVLLASQLIVVRLTQVSFSFKIQFWCNIPTSVNKLHWHSDQERVFHKCDVTTMKAFLHLYTFLNKINAICPGILATSLNFFLNFSQFLLSQLQDSVRSCYIYFLFDLLM